MRPARLLAGLASLLLAAALGCATAPSTTSAPVSSAASVSPLAGNWLLSGSLPSSPNLAGQSSGTTASFDVVGQTVTATANFYFSCNSSGLGVSLGVSVGLGTGLTGTIQQDGSFVLTFPTANAGSSLGVTLTGHVPTSAGASWSGTYTVTEALPSSCTPAQLTGTIAATPIADFTGTWAGKSNFQTIGTGLGSSTLNPISMTLALTQGAPLVQSSTTISRLGLSGSLLISGIPCFTKGTVVASSGNFVTGSLVEGSRVRLFLSMEDGSPVQIEFITQDTADSKLAGTTLFINSGSCAGIYLFGLNPLVLQKQ